MNRDDAPVLDDLIAAVERYAQPFVSGQIEMTYCAHLATWLNGERWLDEQTQPVSATSAVEQSGETRTAESLAAAYVHTGRSESDLVESMSPYSPVAQAAALALFRAMKAGSP